MNRECFQRLRTILALLAVLAGVTQISADDQYRVAMFKSANRQTPYLYPPSVLPERAIYLHSLSNALLLKCCPCRHEFDGVILCVDRVCINNCYHWRTSVQFSVDVAHRPLNYVYPGFTESGWYGKFWETFRKSDCATVVNEAKARPLFWELFLENSPKSYGDLLKKEYGLEQIPAGDAESVGGALVNVTPGMRLRVENAAWQDIGKGETPELDKVHRGYVGGGANLLMVSRQVGPINGQTEGPFLSFEPFLGHLNARFSLPTATGSGGNLGSGVLDPHLQTQRYANYRLFVPSSTYPSSTSGEALIEGHFLLLGADVASKLAPQVVGNDQKTLPQRLRNVNWGTPLPDSLIYLGFRGRSAVIPEILVHVRGEDQYLSVATTVRQVLDRYGEGETQDDRKAHACILRRWHGKNVHICFSGQLEEEFDLPLARGDRLLCSP